MKKQLLTIGLLLLLTANQTPAIENDNDIEEKIASVGFGKLCSMDPEEQIRRFFEKHSSYGNKHNLKRLMAMYSPNYVNSDKIGYEQYSELIKKTWNAYPDIVYNSLITNVSINGNYAIVQTHETVKATSVKPTSYLDDKGVLEGDSDIIYYLQKSGNSWKIISDTALTEKTFLKYGDAKDIVFDVSAPNVAVAGSDYSILFTAAVPKNRMMLGSITNEKIVYPMPEPEDTFRKVKEDGILERVVTANTDGFNEQAVVAVGITKADIDKNLDIKVQVSGIAFLVSRTNIVQPQIKQSETKLDEKKYN